MEKNSGSGGVQSLDRAFDLLELLCRSQNGMAIHQLSEITGLHKSTVHRLLAAMASRGYVRRDPENAVYRAGMRLCELSEYIQENLDDIITIDDDELIVAFLDMVENHKMIVENSGLLTVAALKHLNVKKKKVVSILSGGNMDVITMASIVQHGLIQRDRVFTVSVLLPDKPGELAKVANLMAAEQGNVIKLEHNQFVSINRNAAVELRITVEAFGTDHKNKIVEALKEAGYRPKLVKSKNIYDV